MTAPTRIYLDHNASTPITVAAAAAMARAATMVGGNPSSIHHEGRVARDLVETARRQLASLIDAPADELVLGSSGTEAVSLGMIGLARAAASDGAPRRVLIGATEHPAVLGAASALANEGFAVSWLPVNRWGRLDLDAARSATAGGAALVSVALANHEVGTLQPIADLVALAADVGAAVFCDAVQAAGKWSIAARDLGVAGLALSAHKFGGPAGVGALWLASSHPIEAIVGGGHQERERRPGTENVVGIVGAGAAAAEAAPRVAETAAHNRELTARLEAGLAGLEGCEVIGAGAERVGNTTCFRAVGAPAGTVVQALDLAGFAVSAGAACTSGRIEPSPVLVAMGFSPDEALEAIRVSVGPGTEPAHMDALLAELGGMLPRVRRFSP